MSTLPPSFVASAIAIVGSEHTRRDQPALERYGADALKLGHPADLVVLPGSTAEVASLARLCDEARVPLVVRGGGTGYTGGAVPTRGGVVASLERLDRILEIDRDNLLVRVQPNVITGVLQQTVERAGLFYPPDPASLNESAIGGNVAECAGGPRAFKYGTTKRYVLGLEAVLPTGEIIRTGSKTVKNVVGYDLTQLLVGSEGTLAIFTEIILRLVALPPARATLRASFATIEEAVEAVSRLIRASVVPAALELLDSECLTAVAEHVGAPFVPPGTGAALVIEVDGVAGAVRDEIVAVDEACRGAGALEVRRAESEAERDEVWRVRREVSASLKRISANRINHDIVVPRGRLPQLFTLIGALRTRSGFRIPCFGHAGDGNIHVNLMLEPGESRASTRARATERALFEGVVALEGSISGEHGIGFSKAPYLGLELSAVEIALMKRLKSAFDPRGILNPGKIFPD